MDKETAWLLAEKYNGTTTDAFKNDVLRLQNGEPLAYIIRHIPFLGVTIHLDSHPLIPRTETEYWVEQVLPKIPQGAHVLDLCAGSGCIGIAVQKARPDTTVSFAEIDRTHHETIQKNLQENNLPTTSIYGGDLLSEVPDMYDIILTNPPYIDPALHRTETSVHTYEPHQALYGGRGGTELIERILKTARTSLTPTGTLFLEHEPEQDIESLGTLYEYKVTTYPDQYGIPRYSQLTPIEATFVAQ